MLGSGLQSIGNFPIFLYSVSVVWPLSFMQSTSLEQVETRGDFRKPTSVLENQAPL